MDGVLHGGGTELRLQEEGDRARELIDTIRLRGGSVLIRVHEPLCYNRKFSGHSSYFDVHYINHRLHRVKNPKTPKQPFGYRLILQNQC